MQLPSLLLLSLTALVAVAAPAPQSTPAPVTQKFLETFILENTMAQFLASKSAQQPSNLDWTDDGCSVPILGTIDPEDANNPEGFPFRESCERHDFCYRNFRKFGFCKPADRSICDSQLKKDIGSVCGMQTPAKQIACKKLMNLYFDGVRIGGGFVFCR